ncbi:unnamed protein product, partial [marine sediment metagenome]
MARSLAVWCNAQMTPSCSAETSLSRSVDELLQQLDASNATP